MSAPNDPRHQRYRPLSRLLVTGIAVVGVLALATVVLGPANGEATGAVMVVLLVAIPLLRVLWLVGRWFRRGDPGFALVGVLVVAVPVCGYLLGR